MQNDIQNPFHEENDLKDDCNEYKELYQEQKMLSFGIFTEKNLEIDLIQAEKDEMDKEIRNLKMENKQFKTM